MRHRVDMTMCHVKKNTVPSTLKHGQHLVVVPNNMLAAAIDSSSKYALSRRRQMKNICRTVQVLPERLRLSKVPAVHCNIAKTKDQPDIQNRNHSPAEWASRLSADPRKKLTIHVCRLCCSRALQTVQQRVPLVHTSATRCSAAWSMAPAGYILLPSQNKK